MATITQAPQTKRDLFFLWRLRHPSLRLATRVWRRNLTLYRRSWKLTFLPQFLQPVFYLIALGFGLRLFIGREVDGFDYVHYIAPGLAASAAMNGAAFELTFNVFGKFTWSRLYESVITTPLEPEDVAMGEIMWAVTRSVLYGGVFFVVMIGLGHVSQPYAPLALVAFALTGLSVGLIGLLFTCLINDMDFFSYFFNLVLIPLFLFSGIFVPINLMPRAAQVITWYTPLYHGVEMTRAASLTGDVGALFGHGLWLVIFSLILFLPTLNLFRRKLVF